MADDDLLATQEDVEAALLRPLTGQETTYVAKLLQWGQTAIRAAVGTPIDTWSDEYKAVAGQVLANVVARRYRSPEGYSRQADGEFSFGLLSGAGATDIELLDEDRRKLGISESLSFVTVIPGDKGAQQRHPKRRRWLW